MMTVEIDYDLAKQVLSSDMIKKMQHFQVKLFDIALWNKDYEPCISSLFECGSGSFSGTDEIYGDFFLHNGTLVDTAEASETYYKAWLKKQGRSDCVGRVPLRDGEGFVITFKTK